MTNFLLYSLQVSLVFGVLYAIYYMLLRKLTFHALNRFVLLLSIPISLLLPLVGLMLPKIPKQLLTIPAFEAFQEHTQTVVSAINTTSNTTDNTIDYLTIIGIIYVLGIGISCFRIRYQLIKMYHLKKKGEIVHYPSYTLVYTNIKEVCSFYRWILVPKDFNMATSSLILSHEVAHIKYRHTLDSLLTAFFIAVFWYNPLVYCYRKSLKALHEFQADAYVLKQKIKTSTYLTTLLSHITTNNTTHLYHYFNHHIIKKRIDMITKNNSKPLQKLNYALVLPVCILFVMAFAPSGVVNNYGIGYNMELLHVKPSPPSLFPVKNGTKADITATFGKKQQHPKLKHKVTHNGIDIKAAIGTPVIATANGTVVKANYEGNWGNLIIVAHGDGYETWYAHLKGFNSKENQVVKAGDVIGYVGNTGLSTGPHLHYEVKLNGAHVNPMKYIK